MDELSPEEKPGVDEALGGLTRWERRRALGLAGVGVVLLAQLGLGLAMILGSRGVDRGSTRGALLTLGLLGGAALVGGVAAVWRRAADPRRQATRAEAARPTLRGRLFALLDPQPNASPALLEIARHRALAALEGLPAQELYPVRPLKQAGAVAAALALVLLVLPVAMGPADALSWLLGAQSALQSAPTETSDAPLPVAVVGDMVLRYEYPAYTGLPPLEVPNSNGEIHGPPGTRVTISARTAEAFDAASILVLQEAPREVLLEGGRKVQAELMITEEGTWSFRFARGIQVWRSPEYKVVPEPDGAPVVEIESPSLRLELEVDDVIPVSWRARDDFGIQKVEAAIDRARRTELTTLGGARSGEGKLGLTPADLGLKPGDKAGLTIHAWDNDAVSGAKEGRSRTVRIVVLGEQAQKERLLSFRLELRDALIDVLAHFVLDPDPLANDEAGLVAWSSAMALRFEPLELLQEEFWDGFSRSSLEGTIMEEITRKGAAILRYVAEVADPGSGAAVSAEDMETISGMHEELVALLETYVLMLDRIVRYQAVTELYGLADQLAKRSSDLGEADDAGKIAALLEDVEAQAKAMVEAALRYDAEMGEDMEQWGADLQHISDRIRRDLARGDLASAMAYADLYAREAERIRQHLATRVADAEEAQEEEQNAIEELIKELQRIEAAQRELLSQTEALREQAGGGTDAMAARWEILEKQAQAAVESAEAALRAVEATADQRSAQELTLVRQAARQAERAAQAVRARDYSGSRYELAVAGQQLDQAATVLTQRDRRRGEKGPSSAAAIGQLNAAAKELRAADAGLSQLSRAQGATTPLVKPQAPTQSTLGDDTAKTQAPAAEIARSLPMGAPGLEESLDAAVREMARAEEALSEGAAIEAEGAELAAADRVHQAIEALMQSAAAMSQMSDAMEGGGEGQEGGEDQGPGGDEDGLQNDGRLDLPEPDAFRTPEEYRRALLEGMEGDVPPEYEALKKRYYEELVRQ